MGGGTHDWAAVVDRMQRGDQEAFLELHRLVSAFLARRRAFDFREEWDDLIQEVQIKWSYAVEKGELRNEKAILSFTRTITHNQFIDRLRVYIRHGEGKHLPWDDFMQEVGFEENGGSRRRERVLDLRRVLEKLPEDRRKVVVALYVERKTYEEASKELGIPLGTLKRHLREDLASLRRALSEKNDDDGDPI